MALAGGWIRSMKRLKNTLRGRKWLRDAKVGVFVHWNPSSVIDREYPGAAMIMARTSTTSFTSSSRGKVQC